MLIIMNKAHTHARSQTADQFCAHGQRFQANRVLNRGLVSSMDAYQDSEEQAQVSNLPSPSMLTPSSISPCR